MKIFALSTHDDMRRLLQAACKDGGHSLELVDKVQLARQHLDASFDLAFVEAPIEGVKAPQAMEEIRRGCSRLPVVLIARQSLGPEEIALCQAHGMFGYFSGTPTLSDLAGVLEKALDRLGNGGTA